jgi:hypothetical protein
MLNLKFKGPRKSILNYEEPLQFKIVFKKLAKNLLKISIAFVGAICDHLSRHHCQKLPFHMVYCSDKCGF